MAVAPTKQHNTIRTFALVCVAVTSLFIMAMRIWGTTILTDNGWCDQAIGASEEVRRARSLEAMGACFALLNKQIETIGWNSHIDSFVIGLCLLALMVIVVAGGKLNFSGSTKGVSGSIGPASEELSERAEGALQAAEGANEVAAEIVAEDAPPTGPAARRPEPASDDDLPDYAR